MWRISSVMLEGYLQYCVRFNQNYRIFSTVKGFDQYLLLPFRNCKRFGQQSWIMAAIIVTETLIGLKFGWDTVTKPPPFHIVVFWAVLLLLLTAYTMWQFFPSCIKRTNSPQHSDGFVKKYK